MATESFQGGVSLRDYWEIYRAAVQLYNAGGGHRTVNESIELARDIMDRIGDIEPVDPCLIDESSIEGRVREGCAEIAAAVASLTARLDTLNAEIAHLAKVTRGK